MNMVELKNENKNEMMINDIKKEEEISAQIVEPVKKRGRKKGSKFVHKNITNEHILSQLKEPKRKGRKRKIWIQPLDNYNKVEDNKLKEYTNNIDIRDDNKANTQNEDVTTNNVTTLCCNKKAKYESMNPNSIRNMFILLRNKLSNLNVKNTMNSHSEINMLINNFIYILKIMNKHKQMLENIYTINFTNIDDICVRNYLEKHFPFIKGYRNKYEITDDLFMQGNDDNHLSKDINCINGNEDIGLNASCEQNEENENHEKSDMYNYKNDNSITNMEKSPNNITLVHKNIKDEDNFETIFLKTRSSFSSVDSNIIHIDNTQNFKLSNSSENKLNQFEKKTVLLSNDILYDAKKEIEQSYMNSQEKEKNYLH